MNFIKKAGYRLFALNYRLASILTKVDKKKVFAVETNDTSETGNIRTLVSYMEKARNCRTFYYTKDDRAGACEGNYSSLLYLIFIIPWKMACAGSVILDNGFVPMGYFKVRKDTKVIQLWHGTGSIKKFGQDSNMGEMLCVEKRMDANIDYLTVNSDCQIDQYAGAFGLTRDRIKVTGLPRTDWLVNLAACDENIKIKRIEKIRNHVEMYLHVSLSDRYIILYAPTFRDSETADPSLHLDIETLLRDIPENVTLFVRLHPFVERAYKARYADSSFAGRIFNVSEYPALNDLLAISDALITDYSSVFFDYAVFKRPMFFYADDLEEFETSGRGLYMDYTNDVPGPVAKNEETLAQLIVREMNGETEVTEKERREAFLRKYYKYLDGRSAVRVCELI